MVESAKECMKQRASKSEIYGKMQEVFIEMDSPPASTHNKVINLIINPKTYSKSRIIFLQFFVFLSVLGDEGARATEGRGVEERGSGKLKQ